MFYWFFFADFSQVGFQILAPVDSKIVLYLRNGNICWGGHPNGSYVLNNKSVDVVKRHVSPLHNFIPKVTLCDKVTNYNLIANLKKKRLLYGY